MLQLSIYKIQINSFYLLERTAKVLNTLGDAEMQQHQEH